MPHAKAPTVRGMKRGTGALKEQPTIGGRTTPYIRSLVDLAPLKSVRSEETFNIIKPPYIDQGMEPWGVATSLRNWMTASPNQTGLGPSQSDLYEEARIIAGFTEDDPPGITIGHGWEVLRQHGHITEYGVATNWRDVRSYLLLGGGPVVLTCPWYEGMHEPTNQVMSVHGDVEGWQSILLLGWSGRINAARVHGNYGRKWSVEGRAWLPALGMEMLFDYGATATGSPNKYVGPDAALNRRKLAEFNKMMGLPAPIAYSAPRSSYQVQEEVDDRETSLRPNSVNSYQSARNES